MLFLKTTRKTFENERKIERRSFLTESERERKAFEKLSASASKFLERTKALPLATVQGNFGNAFSCSFISAS